MAHRPRVLMLITELTLGGAAKMVRELASGLLRSFDVREAVFNHADGVDFTGAESPFSLDVQGGGSPVRKLRNLWRRLRAARSLKRRFRPAVSISHLEGAHLVDVLSRQDERIVCCVHGSILHNRDIGGIAGVARRRLAPLIYNRADVVVAVSRGVERELAGLGVDRRKLRTINNGFDLERIEALASAPLAPAEAALFDDRPVLITAGRLAAQKNIGALLEVFAGLLARRSARLLIAGDGPLRMSLLEQAASLGLGVAEPWSGNAPPGDPDVAFLGAVPNPFRLIARADLYVMTSGWEGFPLSLCEAMACGTPVVATDCHTGPREILEPGGDGLARHLAAVEWKPTGVLMPVLHHAATAAAARLVWVDTLDRLLDDPAGRRAWATAARKRVQDFGQEQIIAQWEVLLQPLVSGAAVTSE
jgi:glycosyltransferase involved in cell wall biosynthesis